MRFLLHKYVSFLWFFLITCPVASCEVLQGVGAPDAQVIRELLREASPHDARLLLNLLYWSYQRSHSTLCTQASAEKNLHEQWNAWRSCADRRLNPKAIAAPFREHRHHALFEQLQQEFHTIQTCYAAAVELTTDARRYAHQPVVNFVTSLREQVRRQVRHIVKQHLAMMAQQLEQQLLVQALALRSDRKGFVSYIINQIAIASFTQLDASWRLSSDKLMVQFLLIQELFNSVWTAIETSRELFYKTYFYAIREAMRELQFPEVSFTNLVQLPDGAGQEMYVLSIP